MDLSDEAWQAAEGGREEGCADSSSVAPLYTLFCRPLALCVDILTCDGRVSLCFMGFSLGLFRVCHSRPQLIRQLDFVLVNSCACISRTCDTLFVPVCLSVCLCLSAEKGQHKGRDL